MPNQAAVANFGPVPDSIRHGADQRILFGANLAALNTEAAIDAVRAIAIRARGNGDRPTTTSMPGFVQPRIRA